MKLFRLLSAIVQSAAVPWVSTAVVVRDGRPVPPRSPSSSRWRAPAGVPPLLLSRAFP